MPVGGSRADELRETRLGLAVGVGDLRADLAVRADDVLAGWLHDWQALRLRQQLTEVVRRVTVFARV